MSILNGFLLPLAGVFYDLYMLIVIPGTATISELVAGGSFVISYINPFTERTIRFALPNIIELILEWLDFTTAGLISAVFGDVTLFALMVLGIGVAFFAIILVKLFAMLLVQD